MSEERAIYAMSDDERRQLAVRVSRIAQLTMEPLQCSQGGIPFNKPHLDALGRRIDELEAENKRLRSIRCPDGAAHRWDGDGQCKSCANYATDLIDAALGNREGE